MIESFMYFGIGFLLAALSVLVVVPLVHGRAVRLTTRRLEEAIPSSMAESLCSRRRHHLAAQRRGYRVVGI